MLYNDMVGSIEMHMTSILEVLCLNPVLGPATVTDVFLGFPYCFYASTGIVS